MKAKCLPVALYLAVASFLAACGGGGGSGGSANTVITGASAPSIASFSSSNYTISAGGSAVLTAVFSNGSGSIDNMVGNVSSGVPVLVSPTTTTTYTLTVTNANGNTLRATVTISVQSASTPAVITPVVLALGTPALPYSTTLGTTTNGYYQITGLTPGHRYAFDLTSTNWPTITYYSDAFKTPIKCDPNVSSTCAIIAPGNAIWIRIYNSSYFNSSTVTMNARHVSAPAEFEGAWDAPLLLNYSPAAATHVGKVDEYVSYYDIQGLTIGKTYTVWAQSMTDDVDMGTPDPASRTWIGGTCSPDHTFVSGFSNPESCTWTATTTNRMIGIKNASLATGAGYILRVEEAIASEGSAVAPVILSYSAGKAAAAGRVAVGGASYYRVTGLLAGVQYSLNLSSVERAISPASYDPPALQLYGNDPTYGTLTACTLSKSFGYSPMQCVFTASGTDLFFKVVGPNQFSGMTYNISATPVPVNEGASLAPLALTAASLPYTGQVYDTWSDYSVSGLVPNSFYQVSLSGITGMVELDTWDNTSQVLNCMYMLQQSTATCFQNSGPNGVINVRTSNFNLGSTLLGSFYSLAMTPAPSLTAVHQDKSGPIAIQDPTPALNPVTPTSVPIVVSGDPVTSISNVTVEIFIRHGINSQLTIDLVAPDGVTTVSLAVPTVSALVPATLSGGGIYNLKLNDYANKRIEDGTAPYNGIYRPRTPLHILNGMNANGTWTLRIKDDQYTNITTQTGEYYAWGITFN